MSPYGPRQRAARVFSGLPSCLRPARLSCMGWIEIFIRTFIDWLWRSLWTYWAGRSRGLWIRPASDAAGNGIVELHGVEPSEADKSAKIGSEAWPQASFPTLFSLLMNNPAEHIRPKFRDSVRPELWIAARIAPPPCIAYKSKHLDPKSHLLKLNKGRDGILRFK